MYKEYTQTQKLKKNTVVILGIDPGYSRIGYGVIKKEGANKILYLQSGTIEFKKDIFIEKKILLLEKEIKKLIKKFKPNIAGIEKIFFTKNKKTFLGVAEARGVIIKSLAENKIKTVELSPQEIKIALTSNGRCSKKDIYKMVNMFLNLKKKKTLDDEIDALGIAITIASYQKFI